MSDGQKIVPLNLAHRRICKNLHTLFLPESVDKWFPTYPDPTRIEEMAPIITLWLTHANPRGLLWEFESFKQYVWRFSESDTYRSFYILKCAESFMRNKLGPLQREWFEYGVRACAWDFKIFAINLGYTFFYTERELNEQEIFAPIVWPDEMALPIYKCSRIEHNVKGGARPRYKYYSKVLTDYAANASKFLFERLPKDVMLNFHWEPTYECFKTLIDIYRKIEPCQQRVAGSLVYPALSNSNYDLLNNNIY